MSYTGTWSVAHCRVPEASRVSVPYTLHLQNQLLTGRYGVKPKEKASSEPPRVYDEENIRTTSVRFSLITCQEDLLALLTADPPTHTIDMKTDTAGHSPCHLLGVHGAHSNMLRTQNIAKLKHRLADLSIESDAELFKSACLK
jgi:hypothetical protein